MPDFACLAGAAQHTYRNDEPAPHPAEAMSGIAAAALADAGLSAADVDVLSCVEPLSWNYDDLGTVVARKLTLRDDVEHLWVPAGGTSPQDLLHQIAARIVAGEIRCAVICGGESMRTRRRAARNDEQLDWPARAAVNPMRGQAPFTSELEVRHGLRAPIQVFPLFENAIRAAHSRSEAEQMNAAATLLAENARIAAANPHAWFRDAPGAAQIAGVTPDNRLVAYPYTKRMNAIMDVDQFAAVVVTLGGSRSAAAVLGGAGAEEIWNPIERNTFNTCPAMQHAITTALERSGLRADELDVMDLYSCFPSAVQLGLHALGSDTHDPRPKSLTGGLAYAGGPGNGYVLHSLAAALEDIRANPAHKVLVTGIGMANTKHAATVLSAADAVPAQASGTTTYREQIDETPRAVVPEANGEATVRTYTIEYGRDGEPVNVILILDLTDGTRTIANMREPVAAAASIRSVEPIGRTGTVRYHTGEKINFFEFAD